MYKPRIRLVCPVCNLDLACTARVASANDARWVLSSKSLAHLKAANCDAPKPSVLPQEDLIICKGAA